MSTVDLFVLLLILVIAGLAFYEGFIHHRKESCYGCPYAKNCMSSCEKRK